MGRSAFNKTIRKLTALLCFIILLSLHIQSNAQVVQPSKGDIYKDDVVPRMEVRINPDSLKWILDPANKESDQTFKSDFFFDNGQKKDTFFNIGFGLRGNTSRNSPKKSFKISFNDFSSEGKFHGLEKINLNAESNDPTLSRSNLCWNLASKIGLPASRVNHVQLYINDIYYGLYTNVEHIDEEFMEIRFGNKDGSLYKCLYPADLLYKGADPNFYKEEFSGRRAYELQGKEGPDAYKDLVHLLYILNNTPSAQLSCELEKVLDVDQVIRYLVFEILIGQWDGLIYNKNNFFLYYNTRNSKFQIIPYDLDNTLGIDWIGRDWPNRNIYNWHNSSQLRPLYTKLLAVPQYKERFSFYLKKYLDSLFNESQFRLQANLLIQQLKPYVEKDPFYSLANGFTTTDFQNGFENALPFSHLPNGILSYVIKRVNAARSQLSFGRLAPIVRNVKNNLPQPGEQVWVNAEIEDDGFSVQVNLCYRFSQTGSFTCIPMLDDGNQHDKNAKDLIYGAIIEGPKSNSMLEYYIKSTDQSSNETTWPACGYQIINIGKSKSDLVINEICASNQSILKDEFGEFDDWIELYNKGTMSIYLGDKFLSNDKNNATKWRLPSVSLAPGQYLIIWADNDAKQGSNHTNFKLDAAGEYIGLFDNESNLFGLMDEIEFPAQDNNSAFARVPNGIGTFQKYTPSPGRNNTPSDTNNPSGKSIFSVYPNPCSSLIFIKSSTVFQKIALYDLCGRKMYQAYVTNQEVPLTKLLDGIYILVALNEEEKVIGREKIVVRN
ncbi:MAG: CotH kinase family protein [Saprospiraceae bacterium]